MAAASTANVISLPDYAGRTAAQRRDAISRHPATQSHQVPEAFGDAARPVIAELDRRRRNAAAAEATAQTGGVVRRVAAAAEFVCRRVTGDYSVDEFGFDPAFNDAIALPALRGLFNRWFRVEVTGIENVPNNGPALVVANHAGVLPIDGLMASVAVHDRHPAHRTLRLLGADLVFDLPMLGTVARKAGHTMACPTDAQRLLSKGELTAVFPEGYKGLGKCFKDRYRLQRFGRGGFVSAAVRTQAPIVPCAIVGSEEIYPMVGNLGMLARLLGLPYFPITPLFPVAGPAGLVPLPSKWRIEFGEPIPTDEFDRDAAEDLSLTTELSEQVREVIQHTLRRLVISRRNPFVG